MERRKGGGNYQTKKKKRERRKKRETCRKKKSWGEGKERMDKEVGKEKGGIRQPERETGSGEEEASLRRGGKSKDKELQQKPGELT